MNNQARYLAAIGAGAGAMYIFDPIRGRRRRSIARDQMVHGMHKASAGLDVATRDLAHRAQGLAAKARRRISSKPVNDSILIAQIRSKIGRAVSHPHAIEVLAQGGKVTLRGLILEDELQDLQACIRSVLNIQGFHNQLKVYRNQDQIPQLQGGRSRHHLKGARFELLQSNWSPTARVLVGLLSVVPLILGLRRRDLVGVSLGGLGTGFLIRAVTNLDARRLIGLQGEGEIHIHKTINIDASPEEVFHFWSDFNNFSQFLPDVLEVRAIGQNHSRWSIAGPAGIPLSWTAITTRFEPSQQIAWSSEPGSVVSNSGRIQFLRNPDGSTKVEIDFNYNPPAGALGHSVAKLFGSDPKSRMDDDLVRIKSVIELGPSERMMRHAAGAR